jgi:hypothetical protein
VLQERATDPPQRVAKPRAARMALAGAVAMASREASKPRAEARTGASGQA